MVKNEDMCWECKGKRMLFYMNADGEYDCEPCPCIVHPEMTMKENCIVCGDSGIICIDREYDEFGHVEWEEPVFCPCNQKPWMEDVPEVME